MKSIRVNEKGKGKAWMGGWSFPGTPEGKNVVQASLVQYCLLADFHSPRQ
jgi:hypothetical protein